MRIAENQDDLADLFGESSNVVPIKRNTKPDNPLKSLYLKLDCSDPFGAGASAGAVKPTMHNLNLILAEDFRLTGCIRFNELEQTAMLVKAPLTGRSRDTGSREDVVNLDGPLWAKPPAAGRRWTDAHTTEVRAWLSAKPKAGGWGVKFGASDVDSAVDAVARRHPFHPIRDYLDSVHRAWRGARHHPGCGRVRRLFVDYLGSPDDAYHRRAAVLTVVGAVARAYRPGCKFDFMPILEGSQGKRKSTWIRILANGWGSETAPDFSDPKAFIEDTMGKWIIEVAELDKFDRASENGLKAAISRTVDRARLSYGRRAQDFPRQCIFIGSTNEDDYLRDRTGGRRYWPIAVQAEEINTDRLADEVDLLWGEAVEIFLRLLGIRTAAGMPGDLPLYMRGDAARQASDPGRVRLSPQQRGIAQSMGDPDVPKVTVLKSARVGYSTLLGGFIVGVDAVKVALMNRLARPGMVRFSNTLEPVFFEQLCSERLVTKYSRGRPTRAFERVKGMRAEALDAVVYATAVRALIGQPVEAREAELTDPEPPRPKPRVARSEWMSRA